MADVVLNPKTSALLLQDLQNELIKGSRPVVPLSGAALVANCQKLLTKARAVGMAVIHVRVARRPDLKDAPRPPLGTPPGSSGAPVSSRALRARPSWQSWHHALRMWSSPSTTSPFHTTDLGVYLRRFGVSTLLLTGYSTTGVVEGSLRDARDQDYDCVVVRDCCAAATVQEHDTCMDIVFPRMAWVASVMRSSTPSAANLLSLRPSARLVRQFEHKRTLEEP